jgi:hypothetical protein
MVVVEQTYEYFEDEPGRRSAAKLLARGEARRIVANVGSRQPVVNAQAVPHNKTGGLFLD